MVQTGGGNRFEKRFPRKKRMVIYWYIGSLFVTDAHNLTVLDNQNFF